VIRFNFQNRKSSTGLKYHSDYLNMTRVKIHMRFFLSRQ